jgi:hypothetical protein
MSMNGPLRPTEPSESSDPLDRVLGAAPMPEPDAWFTARTLARCRASQPDERPAVSWRLVWRRWAVVGIFSLCLAGFGLQQLHRNHTLRRHHQHSAQEAFEVISQVDSHSDLSWQDSSL